MYDNTKRSHAETCLRRTAAKHLGRVSRLETFCIIVNILKYIYVIYFNIVSSYTPHTIIYFIYIYMRITHALIIIALEKRVIIKLVVIVLLALLALQSGQIKNYTIIVISVHNVRNVYNYFQRVCFLMCIDMTYNIEQYYKKKNRFFITIIFIS